MLGAIKFFMRVVLLIACLTSLSLQIFGQLIGNKTQSKIDKRDLKTFIKVLTSDSLEGRGTGTNGQRKAEKFISDRYNYLGLNTLNRKDYLEKFNLTQTYWGQVYIKTSNRLLDNFGDMIYQGRYPLNTEVEKDVVFGGLGTEEQLNQVDVKDRLVLVFVKNLRAYYDISISLEKRKAFGLILANPQNDKQFESIKNTFKAYSLQKRLSFPQNDSIKNNTAKWDTIKVVNAFIIPNTQIRNIMGVSQKQLKGFISNNDIKTVPISRVKIKCEKIKEEIETANVIGIIKGRTDKTIVISAHYDHLGTFGKEYFPGADDNASGTAALLEIAEEFSNAQNLEYNLMFLATSGEEEGLLGSFYHVNKSDFNPQSILCNLNLDMISRSDDKHLGNQYLYCIGTDQSNEIDNLVKKADVLYDKCSFDFSLNNSKDPSGIYSRSDQYNFYKKGIPAIQFFSGLHVDYHKPTDTVEKIDFKNLEGRVRLISLVIKLLESEGFKN